MVGRSGSVTDVAGSFPHHLQDICDKKWESKITKSMSPAGPVAVKQRSAQQQAWELGKHRGWFTLRP